MNAKMPGTTHPNVPSWTLAEKVSLYICAVTAVVVIAFTVYGYWSWRDWGWAGLTPARFIVIVGLAMLVHVVGGAHWVLFLRDRRRARVRPAPPPEPLPFET